MNANVCAGIVTFNPEIDRLLENIQSISCQVDRVYIADNGSENSDDIAGLLDGRDDVVLLKSDKNRGIAAALNTLCDAAILEGYQSILLLDQDSVSTPGMVDALLKHSGKGIGIVSPMILDRNKEGILDIESKLDHEVYEVGEAARKGVITSGTLTNLSAYSYIGGFDELFFIDYVDYDFNKRLLLEGYKIIRSGDAALIHECGKFEKTWLWVPRKGQNGHWRLERFYSFGHSPFRCYYKARNRILYTRKYQACGAIKGFEGSRQLIPQIILTLVFESDKAEKLKEFRRGIMDGKAESIDKYEIKNEEAVK